MTNFTTVGWTSEPNGRGTFGILKSCTLTLGLCVYTALHVNIPRSDATRLNKYLTKAKWVLLGVFAPEFVVFVAWSQSEHAKYISQRLNEIFADREVKNPKDKRRYEWTRMHGFYAIMGGFAVDTNIPGEEPYIFGSPKLAANYPLLLVAAEKGLLPDISKEYIKDKSKADHLAKVLVIAQASWLILQVIMRWASRLPVTAIELNTLAHSICALLVYSLWWDKPLDIQDPTLLIGPYFTPLVALSWEAARTRFYYKKEYEEKYRKYLPQALGYGEGMDFDLRRTNIQSKAVPELENIATATGPWSNALVGTIEATHDSSFVFGSRFLEIRDGKAHKRVLLLNETKRPDLTLKGSTDPIGVLEMTHAGVPFEEGLENTNNKHELQRWRFISTIGKDHTETLKFIDASIHHFDIDAGTAFPTKVVCVQYNSEHRLVKYNKTNMDFWVLNSANDTKASVAFIMFCMCSLAYGGVHATAWNDYFPTSVERLLWRISAILVAALGIATMLIVIGFELCIYIRVEMKTDDIFPNRHSLWHSCGRAFLRWLKPVVIFIMYVFEELINSLDGWNDSVLDASKAAVLCLVIIIFLALLVLYLLCRSFLVVEAFISLRQLPSLAYSTPGWPQYLPHL